MFVLKKNTYILIAGLCFVALTASRCEDCPFVERFYTIYVVNNSEKPIYALLANRRNDIQYPDTVLPNPKQWLIIVPPDQRFPYDSRMPWKKELKYLPSDTLSIYIFDAATYEGVSWEKIRDLYLILRRYDLSYADLERLDFNVPSMPTEAMRNMKMWPSYPQ